MSGTAGIVVHIDAILAWGLAATVLMTTILEGSQLFGLSRMSIPFLFGTFVFRDRRRALLWGYVFYVIGGWAFALLYALLFSTLGQTAWWIGGIVGLVHGCFLAGAFLPLLPYVHPRMATPFDGPNELRMLEPPGPFGLNYGWGTPIATIVAQTLFGIVLGAVLTLS
jgi:hypothetical protein